MGATLLPCRLVLAAVFAVAGVAKLPDREGSRRSGTFHSRIPSIRLQQRQSTCAQVLPRFIIHLLRVARRNVYVLHKPSKLYNDRLQMTGPSRYPAGGRCSGSGSGAEWSSSGVLRGCRRGLPANTGSTRIWLT
jgi:hypothetical protein